MVKSGEKLEKVGKSEKKWGKVGKSWKKWGKVGIKGKVGKSGEKWEKVGKSGEKLEKVGKSWNKWGKVENHFQSHFSPYLFKIIFSKWPPAAILDPDFFQSTSIVGQWLHQI